MKILYIILFIQIGWIFPLSAQKQDSIYIGTRHTEFSEILNEERKYWIARMGKQAAMDIISYGRIGSGNMESISMMPEKDQVQALQIAVRFSTMVSGGLDKLNKQLQPELKQYMLGDKVVAPKITPKDYQK